MKPFKFYLKASDTLYYTVNSSGNVITTTTETAQARAAMGWKDLKINFERNVKYWGIFREYSVPLQFVKKAAKILRYIFTTQGVEGVCLLEIRKINTSTLQYEPFFVGDLDFSECSSERDFFQINIMDRGLSEMIKSREDVDFEIPVAQPEALTVLMDGVLLKSKAEWYPGNYSSEASNGILGSLIPYSNTADITNPVGRTVPFFNNGIATQIDTFIRPHSQKGLVTGPPPIIIRSPYIPGSPSVDDGEYLLFANTDLKEVTINGAMNYSTRTPDEPGIKIIRVVATVVSANTPAFPPFGIVSQTILSTFTTTAQDTEVGTRAYMQGVFDMPANTYLIITIKGQCAALADPDEFDAYFPIEGGQFEIKYKAKVAPSTTKALRWIDLGKKLGQALGGYTVVSDFMSDVDVSTAKRFANWDNSPYNTVTFSGDAARGKVDAKIKTSISEFHQDGFSRWMLGLGVEGNTMRYEPIKYFFKYEKIATITNINNFRLAPNPDYLFNDVKVGYDAQDMNNSAGLNEFNTTTEFIVEAFKRVKKEDSIKSAYVASVYTIEQVRAETVGQNEQDNRFDNKTMVIEVNPTPTAGQFLPYRPIGGVISGVDDPVNIYNVCISPGRELRVHLPRIRAACNTGVLKYQSTDKNPDLVSTFGSGTIVETADVPLDQEIYMGHNVKPFANLAYFYEFDCAPPIDLYNKVILKPYGYLEFPYKGHMFRGYILSSSISPATNNPNSFKLIPHIDDDLTLI